MLMRYYKQHFRSVQNDDGRIKQKKQLNKKIFGAYKKLGWTGSAGFIFIFIISFI